MASSTLLIEKSGGVATRTLNRPKAMNALSVEFRGALVEALKSLEAKTTFVDLMSADPHQLAQRRADATARGRSQSG